MGSVGTRLLHDGASCRVWLLQLEPGEASDWHVHDWPYAFLVTQGGRTATEYPDGTRIEQTDSVADCHVRPADNSHRLVNLSDLPYENVVVEFKTAGVRT